MTQLATRQDSQRKFMDLMTALQPKMAAVLPKHLTPERMVKVVLAAAMRVPGLYSCTKESIVKSVMDAAQLGLDCGGALGSAYLIPYKDTCTLIVGYRGMIDLARRSGQIESIEARPVFQGDDFELEYGLRSRILHKPKWEQAPDPAKLLGCYVVAHFVNGGHHVEWMSRAEIDAIRKRSKASGSGPWVTDYVEMAKKTVVRRAFKWLPMSTELATTLASIDADSAAGTGGARIGDILDTTATEVDEQSGEVREVEQDQQQPTDQQVLQNLKGAQATKEATTRRGAGGSAGVEPPRPTTAPASQDRPTTSDDVDAAFGAEGGAA